MQFLEMNGINKFKSPIYFLENNNKNNFYIMRDDLIPFSFGGNKARKAYNFYKDILENNYDYIITYGSASSNHCRIIANLAKKYGFPCTIISTEKEKETSNKKLCELFGVEFIYCNVDEVKDTINKQVELKKSLNYKPYFIQGGGHGNLGTKAYIDAYNEILDYEKQNDIKFDYIFHATGTGTTQAGLVLGKLINKSNSQIVGISVARKLHRGKEVVIESINDYIKENKLDIILNENDVIFNDEYILDGYSKYNKEILEQIKYMMNNYGIPLDTTYTGKAFWGMKEYLNKEKIENKNVLFIHTGGTPLFFDILKELD